MKMKSILLCFALITLSYGHISVKEYASLPPIFQLDDYETCLNSDENAMYCLTTIQLDAIDSKNFSNHYQAIHDLSSDWKNFRQDQIRHGLCISNGYSEIHARSFNKTNTESLKRSISEFYSEKYKHLGLKGTVTNINCENKLPSVHLEIYDILVGIFLVSLISLVLFATLRDYFSPSRTTNKTDKAETYLQCFSLIRNWETLLKKNENVLTDRLKCFHGIRCLVMFVEIVVHTCMYLCMVPMANPQYVAKLMQNSFVVILCNGFLIQVFFVMSGWLLSYNSFKSFEKKGEIDFADFVISKFRARIFRILPAVFVMTAFLGTSYYYYLTEGPSQHRIVGIEYRNCRYNGWYNLIFVNNYMDIGDVCMVHSWYIGADTQLYLLGLISLPFLWKYRRVAKNIFICGVITTLGIVITGHYIWDHKLFLYGLPEMFYNLKNIPAMRDLYYSTFANANSYVTGLFFGYIFYTYENQKLFTKKIHIILWVVACLMPIVLPMSQGLFKMQPKPFSRLVNAICFALARNMYALGAAVTMFGLSQGIEGVLNRIMTLDVLEIFSKLTYSIYIVHVTLIQLWVGSFASVGTFQLFTLLLVAFGFTALAIGAASVLYLFVELPFCKLHDVMFPKKITQKKKN